MGKQPNIPDPGKAAVAGIQADAELQPFNYLTTAAATLGNKITLGGKTYDFTGKGTADTAGIVSDQMAQTLLDLQKERSPAIIQQRLDELKAADPQGYNARRELFDKIMQDAQSHPDRPVASELQQSIQNELAKGAGFDDARQEEQVREGVRGGQVSHGNYLGNAATGQEASTVVNAGESLRNTREANALQMLESGTSPEDVNYRRMQQTLSDLGAFQSGQSPTAQFKQVSGAAQGPVPTYPGMNPQTNTFNPNAAGQGVSYANDLYSGMSGYNASQANPWLAGLSTTFNTAGTLNKINPGLFQRAPTQAGQGGVY